MNPQLAILTAIQEGDKDEAKTMSIQNYYPSFEKELSATYSFAEKEELSAAFDNAFRSLCKEVEKGKISVNGDQINGLNPSISGYFLEKGEAYFRNMMQRQEDNPEDFELIRSVQNGGEAAIRKAYRELRSYFFGYAGQQFSGTPKELVADAFQEAMIVVIEYIQKGKFRIAETEEETLIIGLRNGATIKTFLVAIGRRILIRIIQSPIHNPDPFDPNTDDEQEEDNDEGGLEDQYEQLEEAFKELKHKCKRIIFYKYWLRLSMQEIADIMSYSSAGAVRIKKFRCMDDLRDLMN